MNSRVRFSAIFLIFVFILNIIFLSFPQAALAEEPYIEAESAILLDVSSGRVLYEKNAHQPRPMASVTKITTAIVALEQGNLKDIVTVSKRAADTGEASIWLEEGEKHTLEDFLFALMVRSANDSAVAIAEHIGGSVENFAKMMTKRAKELGAKNTNYVNPHGLHDVNHYTTAYDLAVISRYAMLNLPKFRELVSTKRRNMDWPGNEWRRVLVTHNKLLTEYAGADGIKTGYTSEAGNTFVGSATRNGRQLIAVVLKSPDTFAESSILLDYGFNDFQAIKVVSEDKIPKYLPTGEEVKTSVPIKLSHELTLSLKPDEIKNTRVSIELPKTLKLPIKKGQKVGQVKVTVGNEKAEVIDIVSMENASENSLWKSLWGGVMGFFNNLIRFTPE